MSYLSICSSATHSGQNYHAKINFKSYAKWSEVCPTILFLEGIHQFAVKTVVEKTADKRSQFVPTQIKYISLPTLNNNYKFSIDGEVVEYLGIYQVTFKITNEFGIEICSGVVAISRLAEKKVVTG